MRSSSLGSLLHSLGLAGRLPLRPLVGWLRDGGGEGGRERHYGEAIEDESGRMGKLLSGVGYSRRGYSLNEGLESEMGTFLVIQGVALGMDNQSLEKRAEGAVSEPDRGEP